jgi:phospholipid/cholesterol/gamma-HCH transport system substrate-binding protein
MRAWKPRSRLRPAWSAAILVVTIAGLILLCCGLFVGEFKPSIPVTLTSDRAGLVMESGAKVVLRGVQVGSVSQIDGGKRSVRLALKLDPDEIKYIPANVEAQIRATSAFGAKYVDLIYPDHPSPERIATGALLHSRNVTSEVNTVFENLVQLLHQIEPAKLNAVLTAVADGLRGRGELIGQASTDANQILLALNPRSETVRQDWRSVKGFADTYATAAHDIVSILAASSTTSATITDHAADLDTLLLNTIGLANSGINLLAPNEANLVGAFNDLQPTADLLMGYNPEYTCTLQGAKWFLDNGGLESTGATNGYAAILDSALLMGSDGYRYPDNLPVVAAKGGPGGKPGCGSLPDVSKNYPVRNLVTDTGFGTGLDYRTNPGFGHPWYVNFFPATRAVPEPPSIRGLGPPSIGPVPYPGAPPQGAPLYGPDGTPLYPGVPAPPEPPAPPPADSGSGATP